MGAIPCWFFLLRDKVKRRISKCKPVSGRVTKDLIVDPIRADIPKSKIIHYTFLIIFKNISSSISHKKVHDYGIKSLWISHL